MNRHLESMLEQLEADVAAAGPRTADDLRSAFGEQKRHARRAQAWVNLKRASKTSADVRWVCGRGHTLLLAWSTPEGAVAWRPSRRPAETETAPPGSALSGEKTLVKGRADPSGRGTALGLGESAATWVADAETLWAACDCLQVAPPSTEMIADLGRASANGRQVKRVL